MNLEWRISNDPVPYPDAIQWMEARVAAIRQGKAADCVWLLEHPALYTAGTSADSADLLQPDRFPVHLAGRGGEYTYHGPGQRIGYVMLDLKQRGQDIRRFVHDLEQWVIATLAGFDVVGERRDGRGGVCVVRDDGREDKIAAIGVRVRRWVTFHGISINVNPDLEHFSGIVPCGIQEHGVTSLHDLGIAADMAEVDAIMRRTFLQVFGASREAAA